MRLKHQWLRPAVAILVVATALPAVARSSQHPQRPPAARLQKLQRANPTTVAAPRPGRVAAVPPQDAPAAIEIDRPAIVSASVLPLLDPPPKPSSRLVPTYAPVALDLPALPTALPQLVSLLDSAHYVVCAQRQGESGPRCTLPVLLGAPVPVDASGDGIPDVTAQLAPSVRLDRVAGFTVSWSMLRIDPLARALPAHVYAVYLVPRSLERVAVGFDGRASTLARRAEVTFTIDDVIQALAGNLSFTGELTHDAPGVSEALTFEASAPGPTPVDPVVGRVNLSPVPASVRVDGVITRVPGSTYSIDVSSSVRTRVEAAVSIENTVKGTRDELTAVIDALPTRVHVGFTPELSGAVQVSYSADGTIDRAAFSLKTFGDIARTRSYSLVQGEARAVPQQIEIGFDPSPIHVAYKASSSMDSLSVGQEQWIDGVRTVALAARAEGVPRRIEVDAVETPVSFTYDASDVLKRLTVSVVDRSMVANLDIRDLPKHVALSATDTSFDLQTSAPVGSIEASVSVNNVPVITYDGEYASVALGAPGTRDLGLGLRLTHLGSAHVEQTGTAAEPTIGATVTLPGRGEIPFLVRARGPGFDATGFVSNVPERIDLDVVTRSPRTFTYSAPQRIERLSFHGVLTGATVDATLVDLPTSVRVAVGEAGVTYKASQPITALRVQGRIPTPGSMTDFAVAAEQIPPEMSAAWTTAPPSATFTASAPIGQIRAQIAINGGYAGAVEGTDHLVFVQRKEKLGIAAQVSGLNAMSGDPEGGAYHLALEPGGQRFVAAADLDANTYASLELSNLPHLVDVLVDSYVVGGVTYAASEAIDEVRAGFQVLSSGQALLVDVNGVPASITAAWNMKPAAPTVTYDASGRVTHIYAFYRQQTGGAAFEAAIDGLPAYLHFDSVIDDPGLRLSFDARSGPTAAPGSDAVDAVTFRYGSLASFLTGAPAENHIVVRQTAAEMQADVRYEGLRFASADTHDEQVHARLANTAARIFVAAVDTPTMLVNARVDRVPAELTLDYMANEASGSGDPTVLYRASSPIAAIDIDIDKRDGQTISAHVQDLPASVDLTMYPKAGEFSWSASAKTFGVQVDARLKDRGRMWDIAMDLSDIPATWRLKVDKDHPIFSVTGGVLGRLRGTLTNHGTVTTLPGDHTSVFVRPNGDIDASFDVPEISLIRFDKNGLQAFAAEVRVGSGLRPFALNADLLTRQDGRTEEDRALVFLTVNPLPSRLLLTSVGTRTHFEASANFDIALDAQVGDPRTLDTIVPWDPNPWAHDPGLVLRQQPPSPGLGLDREGLKASVLFFGAPTAVTIDPSKMSELGAPIAEIHHFLPPAGSNGLRIDATMGEKHIIVSQADIPPMQDLTFVFHSAGERGFKMEYDALSMPGTPSAVMGRLDVEFTGLGVMSGDASLSSVPSRVLVSAALGQDVKVVHVDLAEPILSIEANLALTDSIADGAHIGLRDVPTTADLTFGTATEVYPSGKVQTPVFGFVGSAAGLDVDASVDGLYITSSPTVSGDAAISVVVRNLGRVVTSTFRQPPPPTGLCGKASKSFGTLSISSTPPTESLEVHVSLGLRGEFGLDTPNRDICYNTLEFRDGSHAKISLKVLDFALEIAGLASVQIGLGVSTSIAGQYGSMSVGWGQLDLNLHLGMAAYWCPGGGSGCARFYPLLGPPIPVENDYHVDTVTWYKAANHYLSCVRPHPHVNLTGPDAPSNDRFSVQPPGAGEGDMWFVTPDPANLIPPWLMAVLVGANADDGVPTADRPADCGPAPTAPSGS